MLTCRDADIPSRVHSTGIPLPPSEAANADAVLDEIPYHVVESPPPFRVHRTRVGNLPVYHDYRVGGTRKVTILRKYAGDVEALGRAVEAVCASPVTMFHGRLEVKGLHSKRIKDWLAHIGF